MRTDCATVLDIMASVFFTLASVPVRQRAGWALKFTRSINRTDAVAEELIPLPKRTDCAAVLDGAFFTLAFVVVRQHAHCAWLQL
jgi:hypothetical protein